MSEVYRRIHAWECGHAYVPSLHDWTGIRASRWSDGGTLRLCSRWRFHRGEHRISRKEHDMDDDTKARLITARNLAAELQAGLDAALADPIPRTDSTEQDPR